jgi:hypothetical protein
MTQIQKHEKAIALLEAIDRIDNRIWANGCTASKLMYNSFGKVKEHYELRVATDRKIKDRLTNYYKKSFQI